MLRCLILLLCCQLALAADPAKTLRYPLPAPETGFDPAATADLYSDVIMGNLFEPPLACKIPFPFFFQSCDFADTKSLNQR